MWVGRGGTVDFVWRSGGMVAEWRTGGAAGKQGAGPLAPPRETVNFVWRSGSIGLERGMGAGSGSPDHGGAARKNTSTGGSLAQKCFQEVQSRSLRMAGDPRTQGPGAGNLPAGNLQWKNGVGSGPTPRSPPPVCRLLRWEVSDPRRGVMSMDLRMQNTFAAPPPL